MKTWSLYKLIKIQGNVVHSHKSLIPGEVHYCDKPEVVQFTLEPKIAFCGDCLIFFPSCVIYKF